MHVYLFRLHTAHVSPSVREELSVSAHTMQNIRTTGIKRVWLYVSGCRATTYLGNGGAGESDFSEGLHHVRPQPQFGEAPSCFPLQCRVLHEAGGGQEVCNNLSHKTFTIKMSFTLIRPDKLDLLFLISRFWI